MSYIKYEEIISCLDIKIGDRVLVSSDITNMAVIALQNGEKFDIDKFIDSIINAIGEEGTLVFPTYNWGFCKGIAFDYYNTKCKTGVLGSVALKRKDFCRSKHPIYSFAVWGKDQGKICGLNNMSSFGKDSPFAFFNNNKYKNLIIDVDYSHCFTYVHYVEEQVGSLPYRYIKEFTSQYVNENGKSSSRTYSMYVRDLDIDVRGDCNPLGEILEQKGISISKIINGIKYNVVDLNNAYPVIESDIKNNKSRNICSYLGQGGNGEKIYGLIQKLFPICRSITGNGVRKTLALIKKECPLLEIHEVPSGTQVFDWTIPKEWNIRDAYIADQNGTRIIDFKENNLHVVGYSTPVNKTVSLEELQKYLYSIPEQPDVIPYVTSYYKERFGFCISDSKRRSLKEGNYRIYIDSELKDGSLTYGDILIHGNTKEEVLLSTYVCHPSMANDNLSGPCVAVQLVKWLMGLKDRRYTYRIVFVPETIGSIAYLSRNLEEMKRNTVAGFILTCMGDKGNFSYLESRYGNTLADKVALNILSSLNLEYNTYPYLSRGSDERQYCSAGIDLPVCTIMRSKYGVFQEYHTSADNLDFVKADALEESFEVYKECINALENNYKYRVRCLGEPQLGKRGLYPDVSMKNSASHVRNMMNLIAYADGQNDLIDISNKIKVPVKELIAIVNKLRDAELLYGDWYILASGVSKVG